MTAAKSAKKSTGAKKDVDGKKSTGAKKSTKRRSLEKKNGGAKKSATKKESGTSKHSTSKRSTSKHSTSKRSHSGKTKAQEAFIQPVMNIGLVGHVDHGKTTLTERLSGKWTDTHSEELKRGITIRLGYADTTFYRNPRKEGVAQYTTKAVDAETKEPNEPLLKVSFVDAPGHESLMATMLAGATIMDGALLMIAANEVCPQPQTREHLMALQISGIKKVVVVQNKIDLVTKERALRNYQQIKEFLKGTPYEDAPIVPISAQRGVNIDVLIKVMLDTFTVPERDQKADPVMVVARSFDINKPGTVPAKLKGGVLGGALKQGTLRVGETIEIRPGRIVEEANKVKAKPLRTKIIGLMTGGHAVDEVAPGGSIAVLTSLDHAVVRSDMLTGSVVGHPDKLPPVWEEQFVLQPTLLERVVGSQEELKVNPLTINELLMLNVNSAATVGIVTDLRKGRVVCKLKKPVCAAVGSKVTMSRRVGTRFRLIGYGEIVE